MNKHYWLNWASFAFIGLLWAISPSHGAIYPILMLCNVPLMALTFREKNLGFKLWRWVGRKCGWYVEPPERVNHFGKLVMVIGETSAFKSVPTEHGEHDPEMWTETKAVEKP